MKHTISLLVENRFGALSRIAGLFSGRGYNIESLTVAPTQDPTVSRMTIVTFGDDRIVEQITKQLNKLIDVIKVWDMTKGDYIAREMVMVRLGVKGEAQDRLLRIAQLFGAKVIDISESSIALDMTGDEKEVENFIRMLKPLGIKELIRSGVVAMLREQNHG